MVPTTKELYFAPTGQYLEAQIVELTAEIASRRMLRDWWADPSLLERFETPPNARDWNWNDDAIEHEGRILKSEKVAIITGDGAVQGAMMLSAEPVASVLDPRASALFVELLFTAPRNRVNLRRDGHALFLGVGTELLTWAAHRSQELGFGGRLLLDASPNCIAWYKKRGLLTCNGPSIVFQSVTYVPMELPERAAAHLNDTHLEPELMHAVAQE